MTIDGAILSSLVHIQSHLDGDLSLERLSSLVDQSKWHFHRRFAEAVGETPARYVARLRLERAAFCLRTRSSTLLRVALDCGFQNHETFTRAFCRHFGKSPSRYRRAHDPIEGQVGRHPSTASRAGYQLSAIQVRRLRPCHLAFVRHCGSYEDVSQSLFDTVERWAGERGIPQPRVWMGIGHDAPSTTSPGQRRFDAALLVPERFRSRGEVGYQQFFGGLHAIVTHVGPFSTLTAAYAEAIPVLLSLSGYRLIGLPTVEIYQSAEIRTEAALNTTELCFPVERA